MKKSATNDQLEIHLKYIRETLEEIKQEQKEFKTEVSTNQKDIKKQFLELDKKYADKKEFNIVKSAVFGMIGLLVTIVITAMVAQVVRAFL